MRYSFKTAGIMLFATMPMWLISGAIALSEITHHGATRWALLAPTFFVVLSLAAGIETPKASADR